MPGKAKQKDDQSECFHEREGSATGSAEFEGCHRWYSVNTNVMPDTHRTITVSA
jgi:hypothetical protein